MILLFSIVWALIPKNDDTSSISDDNKSSLQKESDGAVAPGEDGIVADESGPTSDDGSSEYYTDDQANQAGYENTADSVEEDQVPSTAVNPWLTCPDDSIYIGNGACRCPSNQVGDPGNCTTPAPAQTPAPDPGTTLKSSQPFNPAKVYKLNTNTKVVNVPDGSTAGITVYDQGVKFDIVEMQEYSNGKKFLLTKDQKAHGSKTGFSFEVMTPYTAPVQESPKPPVVSKVLVFMMENKTYANAKANMPYTMNLVNKTGVVYTNSWSAGEWKSLPNYIAMAGGSNFGITSDTGKQIAGHSIFGLAVGNGKSTKSYTEDQSKNCKQHKHNPWTYFTPDAASCKQFDIPFATNFKNDVSAGTLPKVGFVSPNAINNGHDTDAKHADAFFRKWMDIIMQGPDWKSGKLAVIMTYDEAKLRQQKSKPGQILTTLYHPALKSSNSHKVNTYIQHYSITKLMAQVAGLNPNNLNLKSPGNTNVKNALSMTSQLGLTPDPN